MGDLVASTTAAADALAFLCSLRRVLFLLVVFLILLGLLVVAVVIVVAVVVLVALVVVVVAVTTATATVTATAPTTTSAASGTTATAAASATLRVLPIVVALLHNVDLRCDDLQCWEEAVKHPLGGGLSRCEGLHGGGDAGDEPGDFFDEVGGVEVVASCGTEDDRVGLRSGELEEQERATPVATRSPKRRGRNSRSP